jgi:single-stranded-DNA-specific exonuclease
VIHRGIQSIEEAEQYLKPSLRRMHDPSLMRDMDEAAKHLASSVESGKRVGIYGDYDVDGLCSTSILITFFRKCGVDFDFVIPHREKEGYGVDESRVRELSKSGVDTLLTVDCGIRANDAIQTAKDEGLDVVILDHHQIPGTLPPADAIVNPHHGDCEYPFEDLSASAISFNFLIALRRQLRERNYFKESKEPELKELLDLVALGTIADSMPLEDINRIFVRRGLQLLQNSPRPGLEAILSQLKYRPMPVTTESVSYQLAPRLNAAGRMADATFCVELLTTPDFHKASKLASRLERLNNERRKLQAEMLDEATQQAEQQMKEDQHVLVLDEKGWKPGLLGIVAGRLAERYNRPALVIGGEDDVAKGSARSIPNFNIFELLDEVSDVFERFGGHEGAAGFSVRRDGIEALKERLREVLLQQEHDIGKSVPEIAIQERTTIRQLREFSDELSYLRPFGVGNPAPRFLLPSLRSRWTKTVGDGSHLKAEFRDETGAMEGIGFSMGDRLEDLDASVAAVVKPTRNEFRGRVKTELQLFDLRQSRKSKDVVDDYREL